MRKFLGIIVGLLLQFTLVGCQSETASRKVPPQELAANFVSPPQSAKPHTWWHWMNGNVNKEGITLDLEAMNRVGIGGFQLFQVGTGIPKGPVAYGSPENIEQLKWAMHEADRLGLEFTMHNCPGWSSSGGPWITPELSMQVLTMSETTITGGQKVSVALPQPPLTARPAFLKPEEKWDYYRDAFVLAYPTPADDGARIASWSTKANFGGRGTGSANRAVGNAPTTIATTAGESTKPIDPASVVEISQFMDAKGQLTWNAPAGNWTILRIGHTATGTANRPPPEGGLGLECDKFSAAAIDYHFDHFFGPLLNDLKPLAAKGRAGALIDSYEAGMQNWTAAFPDEFKKREGYDLRNYMPAMFGRVVGSLDKSERFLWDVRKTQANLMAENYYGRFMELCHKYKIHAYNEPYDPGPFDEMAVGRYADMPMGEFWQNQPNQHSIKLVASVAHINGRAVVGAESFTSQSRWSEYPYSLKALGDFMYSQGLNRYIFHRYAMQPNPTALPGMTMGPWGGHFDRTNTWFDHGASTWLKYVARSQYMLQQGDFVADLLYFCGEDSPARTPERQNYRPAPPPDYDFDSIDADSILTKVSIEKGRIVLPSGMSYRVFVLPEHRTVSLKLMQKIRDLVAQGMTLVVGGPKPENSPSLSGYPASNEALRKVAVEVWGDLNGTTVSQRTLGAGQVFWTQSLPDVLKKLDIKPDFEVTSRSGNAEIHYLHRRVGDLEFYFVANREQYGDDLVCTFNVNGRQPELWDASTGQMTAVSVYDFVDGRTSMPLHLDPSGSIFVAFRNPAPAKHIQTVSKDGTVLASLNAFEVKPPAVRPVPPRGPGGGRPLEFPIPMPALEEPPAAQLSTGAQPQLLAFQNGSFSLKDNQGQSSIVQVSSVMQPAEVTGPWQVSFPPNLGAPPQILLDKLISWTEHSENGVKYFSGTATYTRKLNVPVGAKDNGKRLYLDLGRVQFLAEVVLNGKNLGTLWKPPMRLDITDVAHAGDNDLEIRVTNLWPNRLIGDEQLPPDNQYTLTAGRGPITAIPDWYARGLPKPPSQRVTFSTFEHWPADSQLIESGLLGPVQLRTAVPIALEQ